MLLSSISKHNNSGVVNIKHLLVAACLLGEDEERLLLHVEEGAVAPARRGGRGRQAHRGARGVVAREPLEDGVGHREETDEPLLDDCLFDDVVACGNVLVFHYSRTDFMGY